MFSLYKGSIRVFTITLITLLLLNFTNVFASSTEYNIEEEGVGFACNLTLYQNFTILTPQDLKANSEEKEEVRNALEPALQDFNPNIHISDILLNARFNENSIQLEMSFTVHSLSEKSGKLKLTDLSWNSFSLPGHITVGDVEVNRIGEEYMKPILSIYSDPAYTRIWNGTRQIEPERAFNIIGNFTMLDFKASSKFINQWNRTFLIENTVTEWRFTPEPRLNVTLKYSVENISKTFFSKFEYSAMVSVPFLAYAEGDTVYYQPVENLDEVFMLIITVGLLVSTLMLTALMLKRRRAI